MKTISIAVGIVAASIAAFVTTAPTYGALITVQNFSFEAPDVADGAFTAGVITGWTAPNTAGVYDPPAGILTPTNGTQTAYSNSGTIAQILAGNVLTANTVYTLLVDVGDRTDTVVPTYTVGLYAGGNLLAQDNNSLEPINGFLTSTVAFTALAGDPRLGGTLEIRLFSNDVQTNFDNVRLDATARVAAVPEPATLALLGITLAALSFTRRRKKE